MLTKFTSTDPINLPTCDPSLLSSVSNCFPAPSILIPISLIIRVYACLGFSRGRPLELLDIGERRAGGGTRGRPWGLREWRRTRPMASPAWAAASSGPTAGDPRVVGSVAIEFFKCCNSWPKTLILRFIPLQKKISRFMLAVLRVDFVETTLFHVTFAWIWCCTSLVLKLYEFELMLHKRANDVAAEILLLASRCNRCVSVHFFNVVNINFYVANVYS